MRREYKIEMFSNGLNIKGFEPTLLAIDKEEFKDMLILAEYTTEVLSEADFLLDEAGKPTMDGLRIYADEDVLFDSLQSFEDFKKKHKIEAWMNNSFSTFITINGIRYYGEIEEGMIA